MGLRRSRIPRIGGQFYAKAEDFTTEGGDRGEVQKLLTYKRLEELEAERKARQGA